MEGVWSEGGRGSSAHLPELVIARVLIITHVLVVTCVLTIACVLIVAHVCSWVLAVICEPWWLFWLVVGHVGHSSWVMVKGACHRLWALDGGR